MYTITSLTGKAPNSAVHKNYAGVKSHIIPNPLIINTKFYKRGREDGEADLDVQFQVYRILSCSSHSQLLPVTCTGCWQLTRTASIIHVSNVLFLLKCSWSLKWVAGHMLHSGILTLSCADMNSHLTFQTVTELCSLPKWEKMWIFPGHTDLVWIWAGITELHAPHLISQLL